MGSHSTSFIFIISFLIGCSKGSGLLPNTPTPQTIDDPSPTNPLVCTTPLQAALYPSRSPVNVNEDVIWTIQVSGCTGQYRIIQNGQIGKISSNALIKYSTKYGTPGTISESVTVQSTGNDSVLQEIQLTESLTVNPPTPTTFLCTIQPVSPADAKVVAPVGSANNFLNGLPYFDTQISCNQNAKVLGIISAPGDVNPLPAIASLSNVGTTPVPLRLTVNEAGQTAVLIALQTLSASVTTTNIIINLQVDTIVINPTPVNPATLVINDYNFSDTLVKSTSPKEACIPVANTGGSDAQIADYGVITGGSFSLSTINSCAAPCSKPMLLAPGGVCYIKALYNPTQTGNTFTTLTVLHYDGAVNSQARARISGTSVGRWFQVNGITCGAYCNSQGLTSGQSPEGGFCVSGETRVPSAVNQGIIFNVTYGGIYQTSDASYSGSYCYFTGQKRDNDASDITQGCYCR